MNFNYILIFDPKLGGGGSGSNFRGGSGGGIQGNSANGYLSTFWIIFLGNIYGNPSSSEGGDQSTGGITSPRTTNSDGSFGLGGSYTSSGNYGGGGKFILLNLFVINFFLYRWRSWLVWWRYFISLVYCHSLLFLLYDYHSIQSIFSRFKFISLFNI